MDTRPKTGFDWSDEVVATDADQAALASLYFWFCLCTLCPSPTMSDVQSTPDNTHGLLFDAVVISSALYGAGCLQAWFYFRKYRLRDPIFVQCIVAFVLVCDTVQMALLSVAVYRYLVSNHSDPAALGRTEKSLLAELFFSGGIAIGTQMFYAWRIYILSRSWLLSGLVAVLGWTSFLILFVYTIIVLKYDFLSQLLEQVPLSTVVNAFNAACDVSITIIMVLYLERSKTGLKKTTDMINRLIIFTFNTSIPTTICAICSVTFLNVFPNTFLYIFFFVIMGRFYTNSLLVTLNSRDYIRNGTMSGMSSGNEISLTGFLQNGPPHPRGDDHRNPQEIAIRIDSSRQLQHDKNYHAEEHGSEGDSGKALPV